MPTIEFSRKDFERQLGKTLSLEELDELVPLAKAELKGYDETTDELKIELNDTNRPDLWSLEGLVRQLKIKLDNNYMPSYPFFQNEDCGERKIIVDPALEKIRPYIGAFTAEGPIVTEDILLQLIQTQEKLSENFGRRRLSLSIGIYELAKITFPVRYIAVEPTTTKFVPLGYERELSLKEILEEHPKGIEYGHLLKEHAHYPYFLDSKDGVLSFPPIINSRYSGEIKPGENRLFIEATGIDLRTVLLGISIFACNLADRGYTIEPVLTEYPYDTAYGREIRTPYDFKSSLSVTSPAVNKALGTSFSPQEITDGLNSYGVHATLDGEKLHVSLPQYRLDYLHPVDVIEDFAMSLGYNEFDPLMPSEFTVGRLSPEESYSDKVRQLMVGYGFEEIFSNMLISRQELTEKMNESEKEIVQVANPMSLAHASLRDSIIPSLMRVEAGSAKSAYPHKIFEVGDIVVRDARSNSGTETRLSLAVVIAHPTAYFSEMDSYLTVLLHHLGKNFSKKPDDYPLFIEGRSGSIMVNEQIVGKIGEVRPDVLEEWKIGVPATALEIDLSKLLAMK